MRANTLAFTSEAPPLHSNNVGSRTTLPPAESQTERDKTWLTQIAKGDRIALEKLYSSYHLRLARFLTQFSHRHEIIEEVVNDTFLVVWLTASRFRFASQVSTWIFGIAYRIALRSVRTRTNHVTASHPDDWPHQSFDPSDAVEVRDWLASGLSRLPPKQRLTLELCYQQGTFDGRDRRDHRCSGGNRQSPNVSRTQKSSPALDGSQRRGRGSFEIAAASAPAIVLSALKGRGDRSL
jgi:RNA polymerase sigma-70 factor (ECF subfamily)